MNLDLSIASTSLSPFLPSIAQFPSTHLHLPLPHPTKMLPKLPLSNPLRPSHTLSSPSTNPIPTPNLPSPPPPHSFLPTHNHHTFLPTHLRSQLSASPINPIPISTHQPKTSSLANQEPNKNPTGTLTYQAPSKKGRIETPQDVPDIPPQGIII